MEDGASVNSEDQVRLDMHNITCVDQLAGVTGQISTSVYLAEIVCDYIYRYSVQCNRQVSFLVINMQKPANWRDTINMEKNLNLLAWTFLAIVFR